MDLPGYIRFHEGWYEVPGQLGAMLHSLGQYRPAGAGVRADDERFLAKYGWTPFFLISELEVTLPGEFLHRPGEFPSVLYWAYNNELNKDIGLDLAPYLGRNVDVRLYKIAELLPEFMKPRRECGRAVIVLSEGRVIGAWLDAGRHHAFACSLSGRRFEDITGKTWAGWVPGVIDADDAVERELASLTPEEVIRRYYEAIDRGDYPAALTCLTREHLLMYLFSNMDNRGLYNPGFDQGMLGLLNTTAARVEGVKKMEGTSVPEGCVMYQVVVDLTVEQPITHGSGLQPRFVSLRRETPDTGWRIDGIGTGP
ncbi:MAG: DUF4829 domain-containing protein [Firmicutes bacterium]|nr:DUF4829 domain-containing protein [Bacillota bacterium]